MMIEKLVVGNLGANCFIVGDEKKALVIDPGADAPIIQRALRGRELEYILLTHTHIDHIGALSELKKMYPKAKVAVHPKEEKALYEPHINLSLFLGAPYAYSQKPEILLEDNQILPFLDKKITVLHTPGHTPGGCCFLMEKDLFTGDTLFRLSIGRTDFPGGSYQQLIDSIIRKLFLLPGDTKIYPGHMEESTIDFERRNNPFLNGEYENE